MVKIFGAEVGNFDGKVLVKDPTIVNTLMKRGYKKQDDGTIALFIPNAVAHEGVVERVFGEKKARKDEDLLDFTIEGGPYAGRYTIGNYAYKVEGEVIVPNKSNVKVKTDETRIMMIGMMAFTLYDPDEPVKKEIIHLGTLAPNEEFFDNEEDVAKLVADLKIPVTVKLNHPQFNGATIGLQVQNIDIMPEGPAGHHAMIKNWEGEILNEEDSEIITFALNIGSIDYNWSVREYGEWDKMHGGKYGTLDVYYKLQKELEEEYDVVIDAHTLDTHVRSQKALRIGPNVIDDLHVRATELFDQAGKQLASMISKELKSRNVEQKLFAAAELQGGGVPQFYKSFIKYFAKNADVYKMSDNTRTKNLEGVLKSIYETLDTTE